MITRREALGALAALPFALQPSTQPVFSNPVLLPDRQWEASCAMPFSGGVWFDLVDQQFKCWYFAALSRICLAYSVNGISWTKPDLGVVAGTNIVIEPQTQIDSSCVWIDETDRANRYKMTLSELGTVGGLRLLTSSDGIHWRSVAFMRPSGDRTSFWFNPIRDRWTFNVRMGQGTGGDPRAIGRVESRTFVPRIWEPEPWLSIDDTKDFCEADCGGPAQLYAFDAAPFENKLMGLFTIWHGVSPTRPKLNNVMLGFSSDGIGWDRTSRLPFIDFNNTPGSWNYGNVQSVGGCYVKVKNDLYVYYSGRAGDGKGGHGVCAMGLKIIEGGKL